MTALHGIACDHRFQSDQSEGGGMYKSLAVESSKCFSRIATINRSAISDRVKLTLSMKTHALHVGLSRQTHPTTEIHDGEVAMNACHELRACIRIADALYRYHSNRFTPISAVQACSRSGTSQSWKTAHRFSRHQAPHTAALKPRCERSISRIRAAVDLGAI